MSLRSEVVRIFNELLGSGVGKKISELPPVTTPLAGTEMLEIVQDNESRRVTAASLATGGTGVETIVAGTNITVDATDPQNPIVSSTATGSVQSVTGDGVDNTDPQNPEISYPTPGDIGAATTGSVATVATNLSNHIANGTGAHAASAISNTAAGNISATTVQGAINELDSEKQVTLVSGTNIKTVNGNDLLGSGNVVISAGSSTFVSLTDGPGAFTGKTLNYTRVNAGETALEYRTTTQVRSDIGAGTGNGDALTSGNLSQFAATTSAQLATVISDEVGTGNLVYSEPDVNIQTGSYTLVLTDKAKEVRMNVAGSNNLTIPLNATVAFPTGTLIVLTQYGAGATTVVATGGVTIRSSSGNLLSPGQYSPMILRKIGTDEWYLWNGTSVTAAALSKTDDTNVTLTLTGSPGSALNAATGITAGWTGTLAVARGGTGTGTAFTTGSVVFAGASGVYTQDNTNLFFDDTNNRLGIGTASPNSPLHVNGATAFAYVAKTANYTLTAADRFIECTTGSFTITFPTSVGIPGRTYTIDNSGAGTITLATTSSQTIDGAAPGSLTAGQKITVYSNGANWRSY